MYISCRKRQRIRVAIFCWNSRTLSEENWNIKIDFYNDFIQKLLKYPSVNVQTHVILSVNSSDMPLILKKVRSISVYTLPTL